MGDGVRAIPRAEYIACSSSRNKGGGIIRIKTYDSEDDERYIDKVPN